MLEQVPNVLAPKQAKETAPTRRKPGQLKVDNCRAPIAGEQKIWFLGKVIVNDTGSMELSQQFCGGAKVRRISGTSFLHRDSLDELSLKRGSVRANQIRYVSDIFEDGECFCFPAEEPARDPAEWKCGGTSIPANDLPTFRYDDFRTSKQVFFQ